MRNEFRERSSQERTERVGTADSGASFLEVGKTIAIGDREHRIERVTLARDLGAQFGLVIPDSIPIYWLAGTGDRKKGAYVPSKKIVLFFENTDEETQRHELTHAVEYHQEPTPQLLDLYDRVKQAVSEDSFQAGFTSFNFMKNIHEFIADGRTKEAFIQALKKEGLYEEFLKETDYLFDDST